MIEYLLLSIRTSLFILWLTGSIFGALLFTPYGPGATFSVLVLLAALLGAMYEIADQAIEGLIEDLP